MKAKDFIFGLVVGVALMAGLGADGGDSDEERYLKALQGEMALEKTRNFGDKINDDSMLRRVNHWKSVMQEYNS